MISFYDKTFCTARECAKFGILCPRALTDEVKARAEKWWGDPNPPIACFENPKELKGYDPRPQEGTSSSSH